MKPELISLRLKQQLIIPSPSSRIIHLFSLSLFCPIFLSFPLPLANSPLSPPSPPIHSRCLGNNTKRFSLQLCHRGNAWLSSRPLLEARRPPVRSSRLVLTIVKSKLCIRLNLRECWCVCGDADKWRWRVCGCETDGDSVCWLCQQKHSGLFQSCYQTVWTGEDLLSSRIISWVCFTLVLVHLHQESHSFSTDDKHS